VVLITFHLILFQQKLEFFLRGVSVKIKSYLPRPLLAPKLGRVFSEPHPFLYNPRAFFPEEDKPRVTLLLC
jgi:hypothetical protein